MENKKLVALLFIDNGRRIAIEGEKYSIRTIKPVERPTEICINALDESAIIKNAPAKANAYMRGFNTFYAMHSELFGEVNNMADTRKTLFPVQYYKITRKKR